MAELKVFFICHMNFFGTPLPSIGAVDSDTNKHARHLYHEGDVMTAYVIADVTVTEPDVFKEYMQQVIDTVKSFGGTYIVRGGKVKKIEGTWDPKRLVVIEFDSVTQARKWYNSQEYCKPMQLRHESAHTNLLIVEGIAKV